MEYTTQKVSFSYSNLDTVLSDSTPENFANILTNKMKLNTIDEVWNSTNSLFKWRFWFVVIQKFRYYGNLA